jgi:hypothetical protein
MNKSASYMETWVHNTRGPLTVHNTRGPLKKALKDSHRLAKNSQHDIRARRHFGKIRIRAIVKKLLW